MSPEDWPGIDPREYVHLDDINKVKRFNKHLLEAFAQERKHSLRVNVFNLLAKHDVLSSRYFAWAVFDTNNNTEGAVASLGKRVLVMSNMSVGEQESGRMTMSTVRVLTNEPLLSPDGYIEYLFRDFILDEDDDAQYYVNATCFNTDAKKHKKIIEENRSTVFLVDGSGDLAATDSSYMNFFTPIAMLQEQSDGESVELYPFGHYLSPIDSLYALDQANSILSEIQDIKPI